LIGPIRVSITAAISPSRVAEVILRGVLVELAGADLHLAQRHCRQSPFGDEDLGGIDHGTTGIGAWHAPIVKVFTLICQGRCLKWR
jgi:hypothetical protein